MNEKLSEAILDFANAVEAACIQLKRYVRETQGVGLKEEIFTKLLGWEKTQGSKLGEFEVTSRKANNNSDAFNHAYNILKRNNAAINARFHGEGYLYSYWLYSEKSDVVYRQLLKKK